MTTQLIPINNTETAYVDGEFTVPAGANVRLMIKGSADGGIPVEVEFEIAAKTTGGQYMTLITLDSNNILEQGVIRGGKEDAIYAAKRRASTNLAGMDYA